MITSGLNTFFTIIIYGSLILLTFITLVNPLKVNKKANYWFGFFLFLWSTFWLEEIAQLTNIEKLMDSLSIPVHFIRFFTPIVFYFSVVFFTRLNFIFRLKDLKYLIAPVVYFAVLLYQQSLAIEDQLVVDYVLLGLILGQVMFYTFLSYHEIRKHQKKILSFSSNTLEIDLNWLEYIIFSVILLSLVITFYNIFFNSILLDAFINGFLLIFVLIVAYNSLKQKEIFPLDDSQRKEIILINEEEQPGELKRKILPDDDLIKFKLKISELMNDQKPYLDSELNLIKLAELIKISPHQLSYIINAGFNENFFQYINKYRVQKAKELLLNEAMNKLSILGIAFESGFNSKTSFNTTFKKITGQTPSEFKKTSSSL